MNFTQSFRLALKSLMTSKMRAILTMLGIIIGVAAVIIITSLGNGMQTYMNDQFEEMGSNLVQVQVMDYGSSRTIETDDLQALVDKNPKYLSGVTPYLTAQAMVRHGSDEYTRTRVYGVSETFYNSAKATTMQGEKLQEGRFLSYLDIQRAQGVCVIGSYLAQDAFGGDAMGKVITLSGDPYTVIGVFAENGESAEGSGDDVIYIPYTKAQRLGAGAGYQMYLLTATSRDTAAAAKGLVERRLAKTFPDSDNYFVMTSAEMMDAMNTMVDLLMTILTLIAALSLLVGGIGIMNIMLVSVTERTREIGIRKSLGAKQRNIRWQFIIEAGTTSAIGGVIGIGLGILCANLLTFVLGAVVGTGSSDFHAIPTASGIAVAFGVSVAIGVLFGYLPANKAAKLNPIDALRYE